MNQVWAWLVTGLVTGVLAPLVLLALRAGTSWRPPRLPTAVNGAVAVVVHGVITVSLVVGFSPPVWAALHVVLLAVGMNYWLPIIGPGRRLRGVEGLAYTFITAPLFDFAGAIVVALGHADGGVAMIAGMLPLDAAIVVFAMRWLVDEEREAAAMPQSSEWTLPPGWPVAEARPVRGEGVDGRGSDDR